MDTAVGAAAIAKAANRGVGGDARSILDAGGINEARIAFWEITAVNNAYLVVAFDYVNLEKTYNRKL